jgi:hypothetical protein
MKGKVKRALGDRAVGSPPASPVKKLLNAAREKMVAASSRGLKAMDGVRQNKRVGLFKFLSKETELEKRAREMREKEEAEMRAEWKAAGNLQKVRNEVLAATEKREAAASRKRKQRESQYLADVEAGIRNEDFSLKMKYLHNRDRETFADLAPTTVQGWFDHDDLGRRIWKQSVLDAAKVNGNTPGHNKGGRKGALVSR